MKRLKIGIFIDSFFPLIDGVIMVVDNYARRLSKDNDVILFAPKFDKHYVDDFPYRIVRIKSFNTFVDNYHLATPLIDREVQKIMKKEKFDIIHIHSPFTIGKLGILIGKKQNIPIIATMHTQFKMEFKRYLKKEKVLNLITSKIIKPYNECYECWAVNKEVAEVYKSYGYKKEPKIVENGTDMKTIKDYKITNDIINKKYNLSYSDNVFLFVGRIDKVKNIDFLIDSLNLLHKKDFSFKMLFVGDGEDMNYFKQKVKKYKLSSNVLFLGSLKDRNLLAMIYRRANLFLFPSLMDCSSLVQVEAASQETPTLFIRGSVTSYNIKNNVNGFLSDNDIESYCNRIIEIMNNKSLYSSVCKKCFKTLYRNWDTLVKKANREYIRIINEYNKR